MYASKGNQLVFVHGDGETTLYGVAASSADALAAAATMNRARTLNDVQRKYTAAARLIASVEAMPGFSWVEPEATP